MGINAVSYRSNISDPKALSFLTEKRIPKPESLAEHWRKSQIAKQIELLLPTAESLEDEDAFSQRLNEKLALAWPLVAAQNTVPGELPQSLNGNSIPADDALNQSPIYLAAGQVLDPSVLPLHAKDVLKLPSNWLQLLDSLLFEHSCLVPNMSEARPFPSYLYISQLQLRDNRSSCIRRACLFMGGHCVYIGSMRKN
jgi:hypothetical protein